MKNYKLVDLQLHKEEKDNSVFYYLSATYQYENDRGVYEATIPKIHLPIAYHGEPIMRTSVSRYPYHEDNTIDIGFGEVAILKDDTGAMFYERLIKEKIYDMTIDEIEKKLGYKVRVVSGKGD